jgi:hypothetical protein
MGLRRVLRADEAKGSTPRTRLTRREARPSDGPARCRAGVLTAHEGRRPVTEELPAGFRPPSLRRRALQVAVALGVLVAMVLFGSGARRGQGAPGRRESRLAGAGDAAGGLSAASYGAPAAGTAAAVLAYHVILFWLPLIIGGLAFLSLRRDMPTRGELAACEPAIIAQSA